MIHTYDLPSNAMAGVKKDESVSARGSVVAYVFSPWLPYGSQRGCGVETFPLSI